MQDYLPYLVGRGVSVCCVLDDCWNHSVSLKRVRYALIGHIHANELKNLKSSIFLKLLARFFQESQTIVTENAIF